jgi:hypothetical protein
MTLERRQTSSAIFESNGSYEDIGSFSRNVTDDMDRSFRYNAWGHLVLYNYVNYNYYFASDNRTEYLEVMLPLASRAVNFVYAVAPSPLLEEFLAEGWGTRNLTAAELSALAAALRKTNDVGYCYNTQATSQ